MQLNDHATNYNEFNAVILTGKLRGTFFMILIKLIQHTLTTTTELPVERNKKQPKLSNCT